MTKTLNFALLAWALAVSFYAYKIKQENLNIKSEKNIYKSVENSEQIACAAEENNSSSSVATENYSKQETQTKIKTSENNVSPAQPSSEMEEYSIRARLSAVEKFVHLNESERERLKQKYRAEIRKEAAPSLEEIIGKEQADFYNSEVKKAYAKSNKEAVDREVFYLSRILSLSSAQELQVSEVVADVKNSTDYLSNSPNNTVNPKSTLEKMLDTVKMENDLLVEKMKSILSAEQYRLFLEYQNNSSNSDFTMLHADPS